MAQIHEAFDGTSRGNGITLHQANVRDNYGPPEEEKAARDLDRDEKWQDVPEKDIEFCQSALSFLDVAGFRYYIPVFMLYALKYWDSDAADARNSCQHHLIQVYPKSMRKSEPSEIAVMYGFSKLQIQAVAAFLKFVVDFDDFRSTQVEKDAVKKWETFAALASNKSLKPTSPRGDAA